MRHGKLKAVKELLNRGADSDGNVLLVASKIYLENMQDNMGIIRLLLQSGAEPNFANIDGVSTLNYVVSSKSSSNPARSERKRELIKLFEQTPPAGINIKGAED